MLKERVHIARRFLRSIRIDMDLSEDAALDGFLCPQSYSDVLVTMARHVSETGQGAFTWTGPYGSGKSSLVVALSALLNGSVALRTRGEQVFGQELTNTIGAALPSGSKGWRVLPVVGVRDDPVGVIGEAARRERVVTRRPRGGWTESNLIKALTDAARYKPDEYGGVVLFIDEMGKFLEAAVKNGSDIYVFQQLAEAASRSCGRLLVVGILHQSFAGNYSPPGRHSLRPSPGSTPYRGRLWTQPCGQLLLSKFVWNEFGQRSWPHRGKLHGCSLQFGYPADWSCECRNPFAQTVARAAPGMLSAGDTL